MRFDEIGLDADILRSLEAMSCEEMTPVHEHTCLLYTSFHGTGHRTDVRTGLLAHGRRTPGHDPMDHFAVKSVSGVPGRHSIHGARRMVLVEDFRWTTRSAAYGWQSAAADALVGRHAA